MPHPMTDKPNLARLLDGVPRIWIYSYDVNEAASGAEPEEWKTYQTWDTTDPYPILGKECVSVADVLAALSAAPLSNCVICGRIVDTRERDEGGDAHGCEYPEGWTCSSECAEKLHPDPDWMKDALSAALPDLTDPVTVHANMLRGTIAKPTVDQIIHLYGREAFQPMIVAAHVNDPPKSEHDSADVLTALPADVAGVVEEAEQLLPTLEKGPEYVYRFVDTDHRAAASIRALISLATTQAAQLDTWRRNARETFDAMCAMRNSINEHVPMPSLESDLLQGPENSVFCAAVAEAVVSHVTTQAAQIAFAATDGQRLLRKADVMGVCDDLDLCFDSKGSVARCGPCAAKIAARDGVTLNQYTHSNPQAMRLRRELTAAETALAAERAKVAKLVETQAPAARDVLAERARQVEAEGWTPEQDDTYQAGDLANAAACYALTNPAMDRDRAAPRDWPWASSWWKPTSRRRNLVKAGALILAEIERLDRAALSEAEARDE